MKKTSEMIERIRREADAREVRSNASNIVMMIDILMHRLDITHLERLASDLEDEYEKRKGIIFDPGHRVRLGLEWKTVQALIGLIHVRIDYWKAHKDQEQSEVDYDEILLNYQLEWPGPAHTINTEVGEDVGDLSSAGKPGIRDEAVDDRAGSSERGAAPESEGAGVVADPEPDPDGTEEIAEGG